MPHLSDSALEKEIATLRASISRWLKRKRLDYDYAFKSWLEHFNDEPGPTPCVLILCHENQLTGSPDLMEELCIEVVEKQGYSAESWDHTTLCIYAWDDRPELQASFQNYLEWQWLAQLIEESYFDLNSEIFEYTARHPDRLAQVSPRAFEVFLDAVFRNNGYRTALGPGSGDGGVDLRLYGNDVVGEVLTLVQAKRYAQHRPISLQAVQALSAVVDDEQANRGLFVSTSRYLPSARLFAARRGQRLHLADAGSISGWAVMAAQAIERDKSRWISHEAILHRLNEVRLTGGINGVYVAEVGYGMVRHEYALLLHEVGGVALMLKIPANRVSGEHDRGTDVPRLSDDVAARASAETIFRARRTRADKDREHFWGDQSLWVSFDGMPCYYDHND